MNLRQFVFILLPWVLMACVQETKQVNLDKPKTFLKTELVAGKVFQKAANFLEYYKGYSIPVKDASRGLLVSGWVNDSPFQRHRITMRVDRDVQGSILSAHMLIQTTRDGQRWTEELSAGWREAQLIQEIEGHLKSSSKQ